MLWRPSLICLSGLVSLALAVDLSQVGAGANGQPATPGQNGDSGQPGQPGTSPDPNSAPSVNSGSAHTASDSVFGAGCRWDPTDSNIEEVSFEFSTGQAPPSSWFNDVHAAKTETPVDPSKLRRRADIPQSPPPSSNGGKEVDPSRKVVDASYHTRLIDVLTFRARYGSFGSSLNSAGCALPAFSERLALLEEREGEIINNYTTQHKPITGVDDTPSAMFFWAGLSNYDPTVRSDLIQTVVFYGDGCAADPSQGLCIYAAEYSNFRYDPEDHMCMGSNMPVFYPVNKPMTVVYRTQNGFRTQESWIDGKMVSYLRSAGDQVMNSFVITQECKNCTWPLSEQVYSNIVLRFTDPEPRFDALGVCAGGATLKSLPQMQEGGRVWVIEEVRVPAGMHVTSKPGGTSVKGAGTTSKSGGGDAGATSSGQGNGGAGPAGSITAGAGAGPGPDHGAKSDASSGSVVTVPGAGGKYTDSGANPAGTDAAANSGKPVPKNRPNPNLQTVGAGGAPGSVGSNPPPGATAPTPGGPGK